MELTLFSHDAYTTTLLPEKCAGQYWLYAKDVYGRSRKIIAVEGVRSAATGKSEQWILKSNSKYQIVTRDRGNVIKAVLEPQKLYEIRSTDNQMGYRLFADAISEDRKRVRAYKITHRNITLRIGRALGSDIFYDSDKISRDHATLRVLGDKIIVTDNNSANRTFVNGVAAQSSELKIGDVIYIMGLQIIVANQFIYVNNPDGKVRVESRWLQAYHAPVYMDETLAYEDMDDPDEEDDYYYRAPRFKHDVETFELKLDPPPAAQKEENMPMIMAIGPSITMGMASATMAIFSVVNAISSGNVAAAIPSVVMSIGMLAGTLLWPTLTRKYQKKAREKKEETRQATYREYLYYIEQMIEQEIRKQEKVLRDNDCPPQNYIRRILNPPLQIWERTPKHTDFLRLRLGIGRLPLDANIQYPERRFTVEQDPLTEEMYRLGEQERWLNDVPVCVSLVERSVCGVYAARAQLMAYAKNLILQIIALHSYDEVKLVLLYDKSDEEELAFVRWLPHVMDNQRRMRFIAATTEETKELSADLMPVIEQRKAMSTDQLEDEVPYYVVLCMDRNVASKAEFLRAVLDTKENIGFSVVAMYRRLKDLPKECSAVVELKKGSDGVLTLLDDVCDEPVRFTMDVLRDLDMEKVTAVLANTKVDIGEAKFQLPGKYTFMEMLDAGMVEHINLLENWSANDPTKSLAASIGIDAYGEPFRLDLHERAHGPHGLIAGMTGSGKSETIIAYILSMAINYHPDEVAFILIDYKGGGMAKAFGNIPHTAGIITNLDGNAINRSLVSMQSELHRREWIFQKVSAQHNISNIDIYKYQKLYRDGKVTEPLPHLIIVSDEFAELKKDQPDFMAALTSTARVGRSLGVHLILATQKPGGVVDDQIRSNSRFRLCLKVQDKGDSTEMMGRPEAAYLVETGRFYLQVGNNEIFEMGQSAWAGAPYHPSAKTIRDMDDGIAVINTNGRVIAEASTDRFAGRKDAKKQLDAITEYIQRVSDEEGIRRWKMWLEPIAAKIYVDKLDQKYPSVNPGAFTLAPIVGEYDDPAHQAQGILRVPLTEEGNVIVYGSAGSGKGMFLEAMCYSLLHDHSPDEVNLYIIDCGSERLAEFAEAPHVGDVVLAHETEKVDNLFKLMLGKLSTRKKVLSRFGGSLEQYNMQAVRTEPNIVVIINNYANFTELYDNKMGDINYLTREGTKYGIFFVLSCTGVNNVRFSLQQNFKNLYCLQLNNSSDYATVVGKTGGLIPGKHKGRGMINLDKEGVFEFQTALVVEDSMPGKFFHSYCKDLVRHYPGKKAVGVPVLPETVSSDFLQRYVQPFNIRKLPVGVEKETLEIAYVDLGANPVYPVLAMNSEWKRFVESMAALIAESCGVDTILLSGADEVDEDLRGGKLRVCADRNSCVDAVYDIFQQVLLRNNTYKEALAAGETAPKFEPLVVVIESISQLKSVLDGVAARNTEASDDTPMNRLQTAMEKCRREYQVFFVVAENLQALTPFTAEKWYKVQVNGNNGLWLGNGISSQYRLNVSKKPQSYNASLEESFGYVLQNTEAILVKFLQ